MVLLCPSACFSIFALFCMLSVTAERTLLCSSESIDIWYTFDGPLYYLSMDGSPCKLGVNLYSVTYRVIPMFTITRIGYHGIVYYKGQLWLDHVQPDIPCEDIKFCYIMKGETLHETFPFYVKKFFGPEGEYQVYLTLNIVDDLENKLAIQFNITINVKNDGNKKNKFFPHLGGL